MGPKAAYRDGNVLRWLFAYAASLIGDGVYFLALGWAAARAAGPAEAGVVMAAGAVPRALLMLGGGVVADRFGPRLVVVSSDAVRCAVVLAVAAAVWTSTPGLWALTLVALLFGAVDALFMPAVGALPPRIAGPGQLVRVQGMRNLVERVGHTAGPPLAGLAMGVAGPGAAFAVAGALFAVSLVLLLAVRITPVPDLAPGGGSAGPAAVGPAAVGGGAVGGGAVGGGAGGGGAVAGGAGGGCSADGTAGPPDRGTASAESPWQQLRRGLAYIRRHPVIGPLVVSGALSQLGISAPLTLGLILLAGERHWGPSGVGWIVGAFGVGAASSALVLTLVPRVPKAGAVQNATLIVGSAGIGALALTPSLPAAVVLALVTGQVCGVCGGLAVALIQSATDARYLGRVSSVMAFTAVGMAPMTYPVFGFAAGLFGTVPVFVAGGLLSMAGAIVGTSAPAVRRAELAFG